MTEPVSMDEYARQADLRLRDLPDRPMDLSGLGRLPQMGGVRTDVPQPYSRQPPMPTPRPQIMSDYGDSADYIAAGATFDPVRGWVGPDGNDMVIRSAVRPPEDDGDWQVKAYFTNPRGLGGLAGPLPGAHTGFKVYRNGEMQYAIDGGPFGAGEGLWGNLKFDGTPQEMSSARKAIPRLGEIPLTPPRGISAQVFGERLKQAARDYDGSQPYSLPPLRFDGTAPYITDPTLGAYAQEIMPRPYADNRMSPNEYNSNSFAAALLNRAGAGSGVSVLQKHLAANKWAAPGLEQPLPQRYFRNR